jgi:hypothetical protein
MKHKKVPVAIDNMLADIFFCVAYFWAISVSVCMAGWTVISVLLLWTI